jgi:hypothetical protein
VQAGLAINVFCAFSPKEFKLGLQLMYFVYFPAAVTRLQARLSISVFCAFSPKECKLGLQLMYFVYFPAAFKGVLLILTYNYDASRRQLYSYLKLICSAIFEN